MDVKINVGLGIGTKGEQIAKLSAIAQKQEQILMQMGPNNPIAPLDKYYNTLKGLVEVADREPDLHFTDPTEWMQQQAQQPPQPNPEMVKMQGEMAMKQQQAQADMAARQAESQAKLQLSQQEMAMRVEADRMKAQQDAEIARMAAEMEAQTARFKAELEAAVQREQAAGRIQVDRERLAMEHQYKMAELGAEQQLEREKMAAGSRDGQGNIALDR
jgi:hypothetical protein